MLDALTAEERVNIAVYQQTNRSAVNITTRGPTGDRFLMFETVAEGEGSGTVIDKAGHVLTNFHVVEDAQKIQVTLYDGKPYDAQLIGSDLDTDVAVLQIDAPPASLYPVAFGNSAALLVGQRVSPSAIRSAWSGRSRPASSRASTARCRVGTGAAASSRSSKSTRPSIPATRAGRCWTAMPA